MRNSSRWTAVIVVLGALLGPRTLSAQIEAGDKKVSLDGAIQSQKIAGESSTSGQVNASLGYYLSRNIALRGTIFEYLSKGLNMTSLGAGAEYSFAPATNPALPFMVPFVALDASTTIFSITGGVAPSSSILLRPAGGVRWFLSRNSSFDVSASYTVGAEASGGGVFGINFGFSYYFLKESKR
jgi:hypothetical protein